MHSLTPPNSFRPSSLHAATQLRHPSRLRRTRACGFTMMELLVVLAILGLLAGLAISQITGIHATASITTSELFVRDTIKTPLFMYQMTNHEYPTTAEGLSALITAPAGKATTWRGPYLSTSKLPLDAWGEPYQYASPGTKSKMPYDVWSKRHRR